MATQLASDRQIEHETEQKTVTVTQVSPTRSGLERFIDSFFQPANIKWMLIIGSALVLGSSLMLVTNKWSHWSSAVKYMAMFGYTALIYVFAELADRRLGLKSTGNVLLGLCILLMPVLLFGLSWVATQPSTFGLPIAFEVAVLFLPATALLFIASRNIFHHFLRGHQATFWICYSLLAVAGVLPPIASPLVSLALVAVFWAVMTVGVIKVNRHVFWQAEEHRMPRVFGFFPILLLGAEFLMLCSTKAAKMPPEWFGFAVVMLAATVLATTRTIASVFRARTGDLIRPLPWSIALPLFVGVVLAFAGVTVSFYGFSLAGPTTKAVVPTAFVATALMFGIAYDTRHWSFTTLALVLLTVAYQCAPTLFAGLVPMLKAGAEFAVNEKKLPFAFYGITYLPLLGLLTGASCWLNRVRRFDMSNPIQLFVTAVAVILWCSSLFNIKAAFIVAAINLVCFLGYSLAFRDRRYAFGTLMASNLCSATWVPFANEMFNAGLANDWIVISLIGLGVLLYISKAIDSLLALIPMPETRNSLLFVDSQNNPIAVANNLGLAMLAVLASLRMVWLVSTPISLASQASVWIDVSLVVALSLITYRIQHYVAAFATALLPVFVGVNYANSMGISWLAIADNVVMVATSVSLIGLVLIRKGPWDLQTVSQLRKSFGLELAYLWLVKSSNPPTNTRHRLERWVLCQTLAASDLGTFIAVLLGLVLYAPNALVVTVLWSNGMHLQIASAFVVVWLLANVVAFRSRWAASALAIVGPVYASSVIVSLWPALLPQEWAPVIWVSSASCICVGVHLYDKVQFGIACLISRVWLTAISIVGFVYLSIPIRIAVAIAATTLLTARGNIRLPGERMFIAILCNVHAFLLVATLAGAQGWVIQPYSTSEILSIGAALLPALTLSILVSDLALRRISVLGAEWWGMNLRLIAALDFVIVGCCGTATASTQLLVFLGIAIAVGCEMLAAIRNQSELRAWFAIGTVGLIAVWGGVQGWIALNTGLGQLVLVVIAAICLWLSKVFAGGTQLRCFANPCLTIALVGPGIAVFLAIVLELNTASPFPYALGNAGSRSFNTLALLGAGALYFFYGLSTRQRGYSILAVSIFNVGLALLWFTNGFTDPQFYCVPIGLSILGIVELLKRELPKKSQDPLRYVGALVILVSPVFGMLQSGWLHLFSLMVLCVLVILLAIGLRIRVLMYTGTAFLFADLAGMLIQSSIDNRAMLWVCGVGLGGAVIALAALCENHRENVLAKIRLLSAELATWN